LAPTSNAKFKRAATSPVPARLPVLLPFRLLSKAPLTLPLSVQPASSGAPLPKPPKLSGPVLVVALQRALRLAVPRNSPSKSLRLLSNAHRRVFPSPALKLHANTLKLDLAVLPVAPLLAVP
jgi:hypothetical protein